MVPRRIASAAAFMAIGLAACEQAGEITGPGDPMFAPAFAVSVPGISVGDLWVCAEGPNGAYDFTVQTVSGTVSYELIAQSGAFSLVQDQCAKVATGSLANVLISQTGAPAQTVFVASQQYTLAAPAQSGTPVATGAPGGATDVPSGQFGGDNGRLFVFTNDAAPVVSADGRMTGGGGQVDVGVAKITRGFTIHCDITLSNNLEINWPGNKWHITKPLTSAVCIDDPAYDPGPPAAPFDTFIGEGIGELNGVPGSTVKFTFIDDGEPGKDDLASFQIFDANGVLVLDVPLSKLTHGNIQAHYDQPHGNKK
jgi:hypothetical protein